MAKMKEVKKELHDSTDAQLAQRLDESYKELFNLRFRLATRQLANHREIPRVKRQIARIKTLMSERGLQVG